MKFTIQQAALAMGAKIIKLDDVQGFNQVIVDSRLSGKDKMFFALLGEARDGHEFLGSAYEGGCRCFVVSDEKSALNFSKDKKDIAILLVGDTTVAISEFARWFLNKINPRRIAITGSMGKTTTRDMVVAMAQTKYKVGMPIKNYNQIVGISLTILAFDEDIEIAVMETGMDRIGEIHQMVEIIRPEIAAITWINDTHINTLGSQENIYKAKMEVTDYLKAEDILVIDEDCHLLKKDNIPSECRIITVGSSDNEDFQVMEIDDKGEDGIDFVVKRNGEAHKMRIPMAGRHNALNATVALAIVEKLGISMEEAELGLKALRRTGQRLEFKTTEYCKIIDDTYSGTPAALQAAIDTLIATEGEKRIAILGGMNGLVEKSVTLHKKAGEYAMKAGVDLLIGVGEHTHDMALGALEYTRSHSGNGKVIYLSHKEMLYPLLHNLIGNNDVVLVKGSRMYAMETVVDELLKLGEEQA